MTDDLRRRLDAVERAITGDDRNVADLSDAAELTDRVDRIDERTEAAEERLADLEAAVRALRGYVGHLRAADTGDGNDAVCPNDGEPPRLDRPDTGQGDDAEPTDSRGTGVESGGHERPPLDGTERQETESTNGAGDGDGTDWDWNWTENGEDTRDTSNGAGADPAGQRGGEPREAGDECRNGHEHGTTRRLSLDEDGWQTRPERSGAAAPEREGPSGRREPPARESARNGTGDARSPSGRERVGRAESRSEPLATEGDGTADEDWRSGSGQAGPWPGDPENGRGAADDRRPSAEESWHGGLDVDRAQPWAVPDPPTLATEEDEEEGLIDRFREAF